MQTAYIKYVKALRIYNIKKWSGQKPNVPYYVFNNKKIIININLIITTTTKKKHEIFKFEAMFLKMMMEYNYYITKILNEWNLYNVTWCCREKKNRTISSKICDNNKNWRYFKAFLFLYWKYSICFAKKIL